MLVDGWPIDLNLVVRHFVLVFIFGFCRKAQDDRDTGEAGTFYTGPGMTVDGRPRRCAGACTHDPLHVETTEEVAVSPHLSEFSFIESYSRGSTYGAWI